MTKLEELQYLANTNLDRRTEARCRVTEVWGEKKAAGSFGDWSWLEEAQDRMVDACAELRKANAELDEANAELDAATREKA